MRVLKPVGRVLKYLTSAPQMSTIFVTVSIVTAQSGNIKTPDVTRERHIMTPPT
jgi:hypothetical protein